MNELINLFPGIVTDTNVEKPNELIERIAPDIASADSMIVLLVNNVAGIWTCRYHAASMTNPEANLALDIMKSHILQEMQHGAVIY